MEENLEEKSQSDNDTIKKNKNKKAIIIIITVIILLCISGGIFAFWYLKNSDKGNEQIIVLKQDTIEVEYGNSVEVNVEDFVQMADETTEYILIGEIPNEEDKDYPAVGTYTLSILAEGYETKNVSIIVTDTTSPVINVQKEVVEVELGTNIEEYDLNTYVEVVDLSEVQIDFDTSNVDTENIGEYTVNVSAKDAYDNSTEAILKINVKEVIDSSDTEEDTSTSTTNNSESNNSANNKKTSNTTSSGSNTTTSSNTSNNSSNKATITGTDTSEELTNTTTKYGVKINTYTTTVYNVYSDGSKTVKSTTTRVEYDKTGYSATTSEILSEAKQIKSSNASMINEVLKYVNQYRKEANENAVDNITTRGDLVLDSNLTVAACARAVEIAYSETFSHTRPNGSSCFTILGEMGISYSAAGENIAKRTNISKFSIKVMEKFFRTLCKYDKYKLYENWNRCN